MGDFFPWGFLYPCSPDFGEKAGEIRRERSGAGHGLPGTGVAEVELRGMEALAGKTVLRALPAVNQVSSQGVADVLHVDSDLMGAPGLQAEFQEGKAPEGLRQAVMGYGPAPAGDHGHALAVRRAAANGGVHRPLSSRGQPYTTP